jgi:imidazole glycerol-phosphate synthase subunit HisH
MLHVAVLDHGMGNLRSVSKALEAAGARVDVTADPSDVLQRDALCVPGQGIFGRCMDALARDGLGDFVRDWIGGGRRYLGICLGMQVLFEASEENSDPTTGSNLVGTVPGLGILRGRVLRLPPSVRVPHIGWNTVRSAPGGWDEYFYFDHSYAVRPGDEEVVAGWCEHGDRFAAFVRTGSVTAVQFHPEKSGASGIEFLKGWVS